MPLPWHKRDLPMCVPVLSSDLTTATAPLRPWAMIGFDTDRWRALQTATAQQLRCQADELDELHLLEASLLELSTLPRKARQRTTGRYADPEALEALVKTYREFVCSVIAPHVAAAYLGPCDTVVFQAMPSLRVARPSDRAVGQRHRDAGYGHQPGQLNFWMPLSTAVGRNTLWVEGLRGGGDASAVPLEGSFGVVHRFHGHALYHYTHPNDTPHTRVSLDFRVVPGPCYDDDFEGSRLPGGPRGQRQQAFFVGGYYAIARQESGMWEVLPDGSGLLRGNAASRQA